MKKVVLFFSIIVTGFLSKAQDLTTKPKNEIDISYYSTDIGSNISAEFNKNIKKHTFIVGVKCHLNHYVQPTGPTGYVYRKQFIAETPQQFIGFTLGYEYHFKDINPYVSPYFLFNSQYAKMKTKYRTAENTTNGLLIDSWTQGPYIALENTVGLGLSVKLNERFSLNQSGGIGASFFQHQETSRWDFEPMFQWRAGISVKLN
ncbi:MAG: hypothetical protein U0W65_11000 [Bacteroidia bacterium]